ncbi:MAG: efflux RND transporter periplasmic adaptor subunit [Alphaproteobacteria bacterium]
MNRWIRPAAVALLFASPSAAMAQGRPPTPVEAVPVAVESLLETVHAVGSLLADKSIIVRPEIAGVVIRIGVEDGAAVKQGQLLFTLDDALFNAELQRAEVGLKLAKSNLDRANELLQRRAGTARTRDEALSQLETNQATATVARVRLQKTRITAPFDGTAGIVRIDRGAYVESGTDLVTLDDIDPVKIDLEVPERYLRFLSVGQVVKLEVDALPGQAFEGTLTAISPRVDPLGRSLALRATVPNPDGVLKPGLFARTNIIVERQQSAVLIPEQAIVPRGDKLFVFKVVDGVAKQTEIRIGLRAYGRAEIVDGLVAGDVVVTAGQLKIREGSPVKVLEPAR